MDPLHGTPGHVYDHIARLFGGNLVDSNAAATESKLVFFQLDTAARIFGEGKKALHWQGEYVFWLCGLAAQNRHQATRFHTHEARADNPGSLRALLCRAQIGARQTHHRADYERERERLACSRRVHTPARLARCYLVTPDRNRAASRSFLVAAEPVASLACIVIRTIPCLHFGTVTPLSEAWREALRLLWRAEPDVVQAAWMSLYVSLVATALAGLGGIPCGLALARYRFPGRTLVEVLVKTLTAMPTVVVGLLFYALLSRSGPLGVLGLLYTPTAMILGEAALVFPLVAALTLSLVAEADPRIEATARTLGASPAQALLTLLFELRYGIVGIAVTTFGRLLSELGVALMLGGNIRGSTRTLTTAIALETSKGDFALAFALGILLLGLALAVNLLAWWWSPRWLP